MRMQLDPLIMRKYYEEIVTEMCQLLLAHYMVWWRADRF